MNGIVLGISEGVAATAVVSVISGGWWVVRLLRKLDHSMETDVKPAVQNGTSVVQKADLTNRKLDDLQTTMEQHLIDSHDDRMLLLRTVARLDSHIERGRIEPSG